MGTGEEQWALFSVFFFFLFIRVDADRFMSHTHLHMGSQQRSTKTQFQELIQKAKIIKYEY